MLTTCMLPAAAFKGVYGSVWKAIDRTTGAVVAIKQFKSVSWDAQWQTCRLINAGLVQRPGDSHCSTFRPALGVCP